MISKLTDHNELKNFVKTDENHPVWHRVYAFHEKAIHLPTLARHLKTTAGLHLMAETNQDPKRGKVTPETLHGFLTTCTVTPFADGTCSWCLEQVQQGIPHTCILITLFTNHVAETAEIH